LEPTTLVSFGISAAKLFFGLFQSEQGNWIGNYIEILSDKIKIVNNKIDVLLTEIQKVEEQLVKLPAIIVTKLHKR
jgi:hypothetical protein